MQAVVSTVITAAMATQGRSFDVISAMTCALVSFARHALVNDADVAHVASSVLTPGKEVIVEMQEVLDWWGGSLRATGGALVPSKSH